MIKYLIFCMIIFMYIMQKNIIEMITNKWCNN